MNTKVTWVIGIIIAVVVLGGGGYWLFTSQSARQAKLHTLAQCIQQSGAKFYGAFWCPHCQSQKQIFGTLVGSAEKDLPYVECSTPDARGQLDACKEENIRSYPTWKFADGSVMEGEVSLDVLAAKTQCQAL